MTIRLPPETIFDRILKFFGKERQIVFPDDVGTVYKEKGSFVQIKATREGFLKALFRKKNQ
jgi:hypothetical protein